MVLSICFGRRQYIDFKPRLTALIKDVIAILSDEFEKISMEDETEKLFDAGNRDECIASSQRVYGRLMKMAP
jgi:hypothetical protein